MTERESNERGFARKVVDKAFLGVSLVTLPIGLYVAGTSVLAGEFIRGAIASGFAFIDYTQIKEHDKPPKEQSWYNPERIMDRIVGWGSNRFKQASSSKVVYATA